MQGVLKKDTDNLDQDKRRKRALSMAVRMRSSTRGHGRKTIINFADIKPYESDNDPNENSKRGMILRNLKHTPRPYNNEQTSFDSHQPPLNLQTKLHLRRHK